MWTSGPLWLSHYFLIQWPWKVTGQAWGRGRKTQRERPTFSCISQRGRLLWTGTTDTFVTTATNQDATEPPNHTLYTLILSSHLFSDFTTTRWSMELLPVSQRRNASPRQGKRLVWGPTANHPQNQDKALGSQLLVSPKRTSWEGLFLEWEDWGERRVLRQLIWTQLSQVWK